MTSDRIRLDYTSDVSISDRDYISAAIMDACELRGLYTYQHYDKTCSAWSIDITAHDRSVRSNLTDGQVLTLLEGIAGESKLSVSQLLRAAAKIALEDDD